MPEQEPLPLERNLFEEYVELLSDRAELQQGLDEGLADPDIEKLFVDEIRTLNELIGDISIHDDFADSLVDGGLHAAAALEQLSLPALIRRADPVVLADKREPHRMRLEVAASFLNEHGVETEEAVRVRTAAEAIGIRMVTQAAFIVIPEAPKEEVRVPAVHETEVSAVDDVEAERRAAVRSAILQVAKVTVSATSRQDAPAATEQDVRKESTLDDYFTLKDAAILVAELSRFKDLLDKNGIPLPQLDGSLCDLLEAGIETDAKAVLHQRTEAIAKLGNLLQNTELLVRLLGNVNIADPRVALLLGLQESINHHNPERFELVAKLIEAEKILAVTIRTPARSGPQIQQIVSIDQGIGGADAQAPAAGEAQIAEEYGMQVDGQYALDIESLTTRLKGIDRGLAALCVVGAVQIRQHADAVNLSSASEVYPGALLSTLLFVPRLQHAIAEARKARVIGLHMQQAGRLTIPEAMIATLYSNPLLKEFMSRNRETVHRIVAAVYAAPLAEGAA